MTEPGRQLPPDMEADLVALADGTLDPLRRAVLEARAETDPAFADALAEQHAACAAISAASGELSAPPALRAFVETSGRARGWWHRRRIRRRVLGRPWLPAAGVALAALAATLVLTVGGPPTVDDVMAAALRPPTATVAGPSGLSVDGIAFPDYPGWEATGTRTDTIDGRHARTVFYEQDGRTIAYTIVAGDTLEAPLDAKAQGVVDSFDRDGRAAVTWEERGRTCVLSGPVDAATLASLATGGSY
jgi:hypothetical protein